MCWEKRKLCIGLPTKALPGFEPGFREFQTTVKIPSDNHYTIAPMGDLLERCPTFTLPLSYPLNLTRDS